MVAGDRPILKEDSRIPSSADSTVRLQREAEAEDVQGMLDVVPGQVVWAVPLRDASDEIIDFEVWAASAHAEDVHGRSGKELIGLRMRPSYPSLVDGPVWESYLRAMETGDAEEVVRYEHVEVAEGVPHCSIFTVRAARLRGGLITSWIRHDAEEQLETRQAHMERLGNLGWARWNLVTGEAEWSPQMFLIHGRDPAEGPLDLHEYRGLVHPEDLRTFDGALAGLVDSGEPYEFTIRVRVGGAIRHLRATVEVTRDGAGRAIEIHGVLQDVTHWRETTHELASVGRRLAEESQLTSYLQHIIMPVREEPFALPGLRVAARYDPAEAAPLGGDWYQAIGLDNAEVLLAVGDVAGHGVAAASAMVKLRHAITGLAFADHEPAQTLTALNRLLRRLRPDVLATAIVARYRPADRTLRWTHAGHPPMLLVRQGVVERLLHPGVLLGVFDDVDYTSASMRLEPDDLLVMFTDGLIEQPGRDLFDGLDRISDAIVDVLKTAPADPLSAVMEVLVPSNTSDDTCILVASVMPNGQAATSNGQDVV